MRSWLALLGLIALGCDGTPAVLSGYDGGASDAELPDSAVAADMGVYRAHDATIADFGLPGPEVPSAEATAIAEGFQGEVAFVVRNGSTGQTWGRNADRATRAGSLSGLFPVLLYAKAVSDGTVNPEDEVLLTPALLRGSARLGPNDVNTSIALKLLAEYTMHNGDPTAEALLLDALGGEAAVNALLDGLGIAGFGSYRSPCEHDAMLMTRLHANFDLVECPALVMFAREADASRLPADLFPQTPTFDAEQVEAAWVGVEAAGINTGTPRAWAQLLTRLDDLNLVDAGTSFEFRNLLDRSIGTGGGADSLPAETWAGSVQGKIPSGRHWLSLVRGGAAPAVQVYLTWYHAGAQLSAGGLFRDLTAETYSGVVGPLDAGPPVAIVSPDWFVEGLLVDAEAAAACEGTTDTFQEALACRRPHARTEFSQTAKTGGAVFLEGGPQADVAWHWIEPDGRRHRFQTRLGASASWIWTRTLRVNQIGRWVLSMHVNGVPYFAERFDVVE